MAFSETAGNATTDVFGRRPGNPMSAMQRRLRDGRKDLHGSVPHSVAEPSSARQLTPSLFHNDWWLRAASKGKWEQVECQRDGITVATMPFVRHTMLGMRRLRMPPYTRTLGPAFNLPPSKPFQRAHTVRKIVADLLTKLPPHDHFQMTLDPDDEAAFAFSIAGCAVDAPFTFRFPSSIQPEQALADCDPKTRNLIRSAEKRLRVVRDHALGRFITLSLREKPRGENIHDFALLETIFTACLSHGAGIVLTAVDQHDRDVASSVLVWDERIMYLWLTSRDPEHSTSGGGAFLLWESIKMASSLGRTFDLDGYSSAASAKFLASFGRPPSMRPRVIKASVRYRMAELVREAGVHRP